MQSFRPRALAGAGLVLLMTSLGAGEARAQIPAGAGFSLGLGIRGYPSEGEADAPVAALASLRSDFPVARFLVVEFAGSVADPPQNGEVHRATTSVLEAQAQLQYPGERFAPYVGAGVGIARARDVDGDLAGEETAFSVGVGLRAAVTRPLGFVFDLRMRGLGDSFEDRHFDATVGLRWLPWARR